MPHANSSIRLYSITHALTFPDPPYSCHPTTMQTMCKGDYVALLLYDAPEEAVRADICNGCTPHRQFPPLTAEESPPTERIQDAVSPQCSQTNCASRSRSGIKGGGGGGGGRQT